MTFDLALNKITAFEDGCAVGVVQYEICDDGSFGRNALINWLEVYPEFRRKGYAKKLLEYLMLRLNNCHWIMMWTGEEIENSKGYTLYEKLGFKQACVLDDYYGTGIASRLFTLRIHK